jgi:hypothetical protein
MDQWVDEKEARLSAMDSNIIEFLCEDLLGSPIYVDGEGLGVDRLLVQIESTLALGAEEEAIIDAIARLECHSVHGEW